MLPTLAVILWAYGMYALLSYLSQRKGGHLRSRSRWRRLPWLTVVGSLGAGVGVLCWCCLSPDKSDHRLKLTGFLGTVYAEGWPDRVEKGQYPPVKSQNQGSGEQPVYALLHPETPVSQLEPEKKPPKPRPGRAAKQGSAVHAQDKAAKTTKATKATAPPSKKDKVVAKSRTNKKQPSTPPGKPANAG